MGIFVRKQVGRDYSLVALIVAALVLATIKNTGLFYAVALCISVIMARYLSLRVSVIFIAIGTISFVVVVDSLTLDPGNANFNEIFSMMFGVDGGGIYIRTMDAHSRL